MYSSCFVFSEMTVVFVYPVFRNQQLVFHILTIDLVTLALIGRCIGYHEEGRDQNA